MDVDSDLDGKLLQQFSSMGTTDREVLISEFQKLLGNKLNPECCAFFLDMNNWNLQAAIGSYYDFEQPSVVLPSMALVKDVTIGEGESVPPRTKFLKTWRIQNTGTEAWPPGCSLRFCGGDNMGVTDWCIVDALAPGEIYDLSIEMTSPMCTGVYQGQWRMSTPTGHYFGEIIWVIVTVEESGLLGLTQQMSRFGNFGSQGQFDDSRLYSPSQMALVPVTSAGTASTLHSENPCASTISDIASQEPSSMPASPSERWLFQSSADVAPHTDHSQDTEMS